MVHCTCSSSNWYGDTRFACFKSRYWDKRDIENSCKALPLAEHHRGYLWDSKTLAIMSFAWIFRLVAVGTGKSLVYHAHTPWLSVSSVGKICKHIHVAFFILTPIVRYTQTPSYLLMSMTRRVLRHLWSMKMIKATTMMMMTMWFFLPIHTVHLVDPRKKGSKDKLKAELVKKGFFTSHGAET